MKTEANNEYIFTAANGNEFMVWFNEQGQPERIYTYNDTSSVYGLSVDQWQSGKNPPFIHCPAEKLMTAWDFLQNNAYCSELNH